MQTYWERQIEREQRAQERRTEMIRTEGWRERYGKPWHGSRRWSKVSADRNGSRRARATVRADKRALEVN